MVSISGSKKLKRQMAPTFWGITRKDKRFVVTVKPGPHPKNNSIPTAVLLRDTLKLVTTLREAKSTIYDGKVTIDGIKRKSLHHGIGLMDVIELEGVSDTYRLVPQKGHVLKPLKMLVSLGLKEYSARKALKPDFVGRIGFSFHDGRSL